MSFIQRELDLVAAELAKNPDNNRYAELYAVQQALAWALEPNGFKRPSVLLTGILEDSEDCSVVLRQPSSSDTYCQNG